MKYKCPECNGDLYKYEFNDSCKCDNCGTTHTMSFINGYWKGYKEGYIDREKDIELIKEQKKQWRNLRYYLNS